MDKDYSQKEDGFKQVFLFDEDNISVDVKKSILHTDEKINIDEIIKNSVGEDEYKSNHKDFSGTFRFIKDVQDDEGDVADLCNEVLDIIISLQEEKQVIYGVRVYVSQNRTIWTIPYKQYRSVEDILKNGYLSNEEKDELASKHYNLIDIMAKKYSRLFNDSLGYSYEDLYESSMIGFTKALNAYNNSYKSVKFETVASAIIKNEILDMVRKTKNISNEVLFGDEGDEEDGSSFCVAGSKHMEDNKSEEVYENIEAKASLEKFLDVLNAEEKFIVEKYFGLNGCARLTQVEIAKELHLSQPAILRKIQLIMNKLKAEASDKNYSMEDFL